MWDKQCDLVPVCHVNYEKVRLPVCSFLTRGASNRFRGFQECQEHFEKVCHTEHDRVCSVHSNRVCVEVPRSYAVPVAVAQPAVEGGLKGLLKSLKFAKLAKLKAHKAEKLNWLKGDKGKIFKRFAEESGAAEDRSEELDAARKALEDLRDQVDEEMAALSEGTNKVTNLSRLCQIRVWVTSESNFLFSTRPDVRPKTEPPNCKGGLWRMSGPKLMTKFLPWRTRLYSTFLCLSIPPSSLAFAFRSTLANVGGAAQRDPKDASRSSFCPTTSASGDLSRETRGTRNGLSASRRQPIMLQASAKYNILLLA